MNDQPKHTTGEWFAKRAIGGGYVEWYVGRDGEARAIAGDIIDPETGQPSEANARLIAAAPKMADEIEQLKQENAELLAKLTPLVIHPSYMVSVNDVNEARELVRRLTEKDGVDGQWEEGREV